MPHLEDAFPSWLAALCTSQGISETITVLGQMGDTEAAQVAYESYAARLTAWGATIPGQPSTATLPDIPLPYARAANTITLASLSSVDNS